MGYHRDLDEHPSNEIGPDGGPNRLHARKLPLVDGIERQIGVGAVSELMSAFIGECLLC